MKLLRRIIVPLVWFLLFAAGISAILVFSETAREVALDSLQLIFTIVTTPFVLETVSIFIFLLCLLAYNRWRLHKEGDGWVYLTTQEPEMAGAGPGVSRKTHSMILPNKPEAVHEEEDEAGVIEGYLELGLATQALEELNRAELASAQTLDIVLLRIRVLAANLDTSAALALAHETAVRDPQSRTRLAVNAEHTAAWMREHLPSHPDEARLWLEEAGRLTA